ncbi:hypothetical protein CB1_000121002 [Camelus ferus]|nr:hypothetical protein CB1_000121002 [Camelus ferus]
MKVGGLFLFAVLLTLSKELQAAGICERQCREDKDCGRGKQCIRKGCGHICSYTARTGLCEQQCRRHQDCGAGKQCIRKGCSRVCSRTPDAGSQFSAEVFLAIGICVDQCREDRDCGAGSRTAVSKAIELRLRVSSKEQLA